MEAELIRKFETVFKPVDKNVKEEELLLFLDKQLPERFSRETFAELKTRVLERGQELTPLNFARTYYQAYQLLEIKKDRTFMDMNSIDRTIQKLRTDRNNGFSKLVFNDAFLEQAADSSNFVTIEYSPDFSTNIYEFANQTQHFLVLPDPGTGDRIPLRVTLKSPHGKVIDSKNASVASADLETNRVKFSDGSTLSFASYRTVSDPKLLEQELTAAKTENQQYEAFVKDRHSYLANYFPDVFGIASPSKKAKQNCGFFLITAFVVTFIVAMISLYLNFTRCMFMDVLVTMSFFANAYIWRYFSMFLAIKLIIVLVVSIGLDLYWEIHKAITFNANYEQTVKSERIKGLVLTGLLIILKLLLILVYYKLSREDQTDGFLGLNQEMSVNEVAPEDYLINPVVADKPNA